MSAGGLEVAGLALRTAKGKQGVPGVVALLLLDDGGEGCHGLAGLALSEQRLTELVLALDVVRVAFEGLARREDRLAEVLLQPLEARELGPGVGVVEPTDVGLSG